MSGVVTTMAADAIRVSAMALTARRRNPRVSEMSLGNSPRRHAARNAPDQQAGNGVDDQGQREEDQGHLHQGAGVDSAAGFVELIGDRTGRGITRGEQRARKSRT